MSENEHYPERIRIDRGLDNGRLQGPYSADRTNGRPDMDSCIYVRADLHQGAVEGTPEERIAEVLHSIGFGAERHALARHMLAFAQDPYSPRGR